MKIYVKASADSDRRQFCIDCENTLKQELLDSGVTQETLNQLYITVIPAGSGFRATITLPAKAFHGAKASEFFYKRDVDEALANLISRVDYYDLVGRQSELLKPSRPQSSTAKYVSEARNTSDPDRLRELANHNAKSVRQAVAKNKNTPEDALYQLLTEGFDIRLGRFSPSYYRKIAELGDSYKRSLLYHNDIPEDLIRDIFDYAMSTDNQELLEEIAGHRNVPEDIAEELYNLDDKNIDWRLKCNYELNKISTISDDMYQGIKDRRPEWTFEGRRWAW